MLRSLQQASTALHRPGFLFFVKRVYGLARSAAKVRRDESRMFCASLVLVARVLLRHPWMLAAMIRAKLESLRRGDDFDHPLQD